MRLKINRFQHIAIITTSPTRTIQLLQRSLLMLTLFTLFGTKMSNRNLNLRGSRHYVHRKKLEHGFDVITRMYGSEKIFYSAQRN